MPGQGIGGSSLLLPLENWVLLRVVAALRNFLIYLGAIILSVDILILL